MEEKRLQWHAAFQAVLEIELQEEAEYLRFEKEHNLTKKPLQIDTLVIKVEPGRKIQKKLGRMFRRYNIIEYKSPKDFFSINDFFKVTAYTCLYQSDTRRVLEIRPEELTITIVCSRYPDGMLKYLKKWCGAEAVKKEPGIYYIMGLMFPVQILVNKELSKDENIWLSRLRDDLEAAEDMRVLAQACKGRENDPLYEAAMDLIIRANKETHKEAETRMLKDTLREIFADELVEERTEGKAEGKTGAVLLLLSEHGNIPEDLKKAVLREQNEDRLNEWVLLAAKVADSSDFARAAGIDLE